MHFQSYHLRLAGTVNHYLKIRKISFIAIWENLESYKEFIESDNYLEYSNNLLYTNQWGGNIEIASIVKTFNSEINIYTRNNIRTKKLLYTKEPQIRNIINESINN